MDSRGTALSSRPHGELRDLALREDRVIRSFSAARRFVMKWEESLFASGRPLDTGPWQSAQSSHRRSGLGRIRGRSGPFARGFNRRLDPLRAVEGSYHLYISLACPWAATLIVSIEKTRPLSAYDRRPGATARLGSRWRGIDRYSERFAFLRRRISRPIIISIAGEGGLGIGDASHRQQLRGRHLPGCSRRFRALGDPAVELFLRHRAGQEQLSEFIYRR